MSPISANQHSQYNCVNIWLGSDSTDIPICLSCECNRNLPGLVFVFICFCSAFAGSWDFLIYLTAIYCFAENTISSYSTRIYWTECRGGQNICHIMGYLSTRKLILHQVSSIFLGSGSRGKRSLDTRRTACTAKLREGLDGKKHLRSPPASRLQTTCRDTGIRHMYN